MLGIKLYKNNADDMARYTKIAVSCNEEGGVTIKDKGDYYEVVEIQEYVPTEVEMKQQLKQVVQSYMDVKVQERDYDDIVSACSYSSSTDHIFAAEGVTCVKWRDAVWRKYFDVLADVDAGIRKFPTAEEMIEELPVLEWQTDIFDGNSKAVVILI